MNPVDIAQTLEALTGLAQMLDRLGIPGLVLLALSGPAFVVLAVLFIEYQRGTKQRSENAELLAAMRDENARSRTAASLQLEAYRADTQSVLRELGANQDKTDRYYRDNVELVKKYEHIAKNLQDVVVSNTVVMTRLTTILEERRKHE